MYSYTKVKINKNKLFFKQFNNLNIFKVDQIN